MWIVTRHQYGISVLVSQMSFRRETVGGVGKCRLFSQARVCMDSDLQWNCHVKCKCYSFFKDYYHDVDEGDNDDKDECADGGVGSDFNNKKYSLLLNNFQYFHEIIFNTVLVLYLYLYFIYLPHR